MNKQIYLVRGFKGESYNTFGERIRKELDKLIVQKSILQLSFTITESAPPTISIIPFKRQKLASITIIKESTEPIENLLNLAGYDSAYSVTEALPVAYNKDWPDGEKTPGVCLLTLFKQRKGIDYETFIDRWHNSHTPLSLKIHPLWHYSRNVIGKKLSQNSNNWDGIVEEHMRTRSELLNPLKFFGPIHLIIQRMIHVYTDTKSFLDYKTIETYLVVEYHLKS